jgi:rod shape-determining protein MreB
LIPVGGNRLDESIKNMVKRKYNLYIGDKTAENLKKKLACAFPTVEATVKVYGRDVVTGLPTEMEVSSSNIFEAISEYLFSIIDATKIILERTPPEISSDIIDSGIYVTGGSANILSLADLMHQETDLKINICPDSANTVVNGLGKIMEDPKLNILADVLKPKLFV